MTATPWASIADIATVTGKTVTAAIRDQAAAAIELHTGAIESVPRVDMSRRDAYWLRQAVCFQAAWLESTPDYLERNDIKTTSQDGASATGGPDWLTIAPLARKAIKKLSWRGTRTLFTGNSYNRPGTTNALAEGQDNRQGWLPL
jgi:hypothetical protein